MTGCSARWGICYQEEQRGPGWESLVAPGEKIKAGTIAGKNEEGLEEAWKARNDVESDEKCTFLYLLKHCTGLRTPGFLSGWIYCHRAPWRQGADQLILKQKTERDINLLRQGKSQPLTLWVISSDAAFLGPTQECMCLDGYTNHLHSKLVWKVNFMYGADMKSLGVRESPIAKRLKALETHGRSFPFWISVSQRLWEASELLDPCEQNLFLPDTVHLVWTCSEKKMVMN